MNASSSLLFEQPKQEGICIVDDPRAATANTSGETYPSQYRLAIEEPQTGWEVRQ